MAKRGAAAATVEAERPTDDQDVDGQESVALAEEEVSVELVDEPGDGESQGTRGEQDATRGDGKKVKTAEELAEENRNLRGALRQQRERGRSLLSKLEAEKARAATSERQTAEAKRRAEAEKDLEGLDDKESLKEAAPQLGDYLTKRHIDPVFSKLRMGQLRLSQKMARKEYKDYDKVLEDSGIAEAIEIGEDGKAKDPVMWRELIVESEDPAEDAYQLGLAILKERNGGTAREERAADEEIDDLNERSGGRAEGRREVIERVTRAASRPIGIGGLPTAPAREKRQITRKDIDNMSDEEYDRLPQHVKTAYLQG